MGALPGDSAPHAVLAEQELHLTAVGLAVAEGRLSVDDPVLDFFPADDRAG